MTLGNPARLRLAAARAAVLASLLGGCGQKLQDQYSVQIIGPTGMNYLGDARTMVMDVGGKEVSRTSIAPGQPFSLTGSGIGTTLNSTGVIRLRALDAAGALVAYGQSPEIELQLANYQLRVFVQKPGTFGRGLALDAPHRNLMAVSALAAPPTGSGALPMAVGFFGMGLITGQVTPDGGMPMTIEVPSDLFYVYNPLTHTTDEPTDDPGIGGTVAGARQFRTDVAYLVRPDSSIYIFGGQATPVPNMPTKATSQLDVVRIVRPDFDVFAQRVVVMARVSDKPGVARSRTVLADADKTYAFGGDADGTELDTVVALNPMAEDAFVILDAHMGAPRVGHTATSVMVSSLLEVLVVGGDKADAAVAEVLVSTPMPHFIPVEGSPASTRWNHRAVPLPNNQVLIVGGMSAAGPLGDTLLYSPGDRRLVPGPITLATPRSDFVAFIVDGDLVVAGGVDASGNRIGNAEVFNVTDTGLARRGVVPCEARSGAAVAVMPNESALIIGGTAADNTASAVLEVYQPFR